MWRYGCGGWTTGVPRGLPGFPRRGGLTPEMMRFTVTGYSPTARAITRTLRPAA